MQWRFHTDFAVGIPVDGTDVLVVLANVPAYPVAPRHRTSRMRNAGTAAE